MWKVKGHQYNTWYKLVNKIFCFHCHVQYRTYTFIPHVYQHVYFLGYTISFAAPRRQRFGPPLAPPCVLAVPAPWCETCVWWQPTLPLWRFTRYPGGWKIIVHIYIGGCCKYWFMWFHSFLILSWMRNLSSWMLKHPYKQMLFMEFERNHLAKRSFAESQIFAPSWHRMENQLLWAANSALKAHRVKVTKWLSHGPMLPVPTDLLLGVDSILNQNISL